MSNEIIVHNPTFNEMEKLAQSIAASGLFGMKTKDQALALMSIAQAEGMHPASAAMEYNIIQGRPSRTAESILTRFQKAGGKVDWHEYNDEKVSGTFSHPQGGSVKIEWDMERAKRAQLTGKDTWKKWPRNMLRSRCITEGCRMVYPGSTNNFYTPDEVEEFDKKEPININKQIEQDNKKSFQNTTIDIATHLEVTEQNKISLFKTAKGLALDYGVDLITQLDLIKAIVKDVFDKRPLLSELDKCLRETYEEHLKGKE